MPTRPSWPSNGLLSVQISDPLSWVGISVPATLDRGEFRPSLKRVICVEVRSGCTKENPVIVLAKRVGQHYTHTPKKLKVESTKAS
jgi:hypothetical protein